MSTANKTSKLISICNFPKIIIYSFQFSAKAVPSEAQQCAASLECETPVSLCFAAEPELLRATIPALVARNLTQKQPRKHFGEIGQGESVTTSMLLKICEALNCDISKIMTSKIIESVKKRKI